MSLRARRERMKSRSIAGLLNRTFTNVRARIPDDSRGSGCRRSPLPSAGQPGSGKTCTREEKGALMRFTRLLLLLLAAAAIGAAVDGWSALRLLFPLVCRSFRTPVDRQMVAGI